MPRRTSCRRNPACVRWPNGVRRAGDDRDIAMSQRLQVVGDFGGAVVVVRDQHALGLIHRHRRDAHVAATDLVEHVGQRLVFRHAWHQHHAVQLLLLHEAAHAVDIVRAAAVARMHDQFEARIAQAVERPVLHVDDELRGRVVVDHADQERAPERQSARQRVWRVAHLSHQRFDLLARVLAHQRRTVDDPGHRLLRHAHRRAMSLMVAGLASAGRSFPVVFEAGMARGSRPCQIDGSGFDSSPRRTAAAFPSAGAGSPAPAGGQSAPRSPATRARQRGSPSTGAVPANARTQS